MCGGTHGLVLHAREDDVEHLRESGLGRGLVDEVAAGQVDVVAGPDGEQHRALVDLDVWRRHGRQQRLQGGETTGSHRLLLILHNSLPVRRRESF